MDKYPIAEIFTSINGEGLKSGQLALFIRFPGCNLTCSYCDTKWANGKDTKFELKTKDELLEIVKKSGVKNITITGGEPLLQQNLIGLITYLSDNYRCNIEIETNGSICIKSIKELAYRTSITMDYKLPSSNEECKMLYKNFEFLTLTDTLKFVVSDYEDLNVAKSLIEKFKVKGCVNIFFSPVFGKIEPVEIVNFIKSHNLNEVRLQLQMHKIIWHPEAIGV